MRNKYAKDGLVVISVNLDGPLEDKEESKKKREKVETFLKDKKSTLVNVMLDEKDDVWAEKLNIEGLPTVFVFNPEGKIEKRFPNPDAESFTHEDIEKLATKLLKK